MTKPSTITQWLQKPASFSADDRRTAAALLKAFPYFVPAKYMEAAEQHKKQAFAPQTLTMMHLYQGNWIQFYEFMEASDTGSVIVQDQEDEETDSAEVFEEPVVSAVYEKDNFSGKMDLEEDGEEDEEFSDFESWDDEEDYTEVEDIEDVPPPPKQVFPRPSKPVFSRKPEPKQTEPAKTDIQKQAEPVQKIKPIEHEELNQAPVQPKPVKKADPLIQPIYTEEYFLHQGIQVSDFVSPEPSEAKAVTEGVDKSLMVVMSFAEWLTYFKTKGEKTKEEVEDQKALKSMWQKEKLAAALEEENEEIPEAVFEMAVNSITKEDDLASESLAEIMVKQGKYDKAIDMYRKLSLRNPQKSAYFARKIDRIIKENES